MLRAARRRSSSGPTLGAVSLGFSLLEILLVLGIAAALIIAAFMIYPKVRNAQQAIAEQSNLNAITSGLRALYNGQSDYSSLSNSVAFQGMVFPDSMVSPTGGVTNVWGGTVSVNSSGGLFPNGFVIEEDGLPTNACVALVSQAASSFALIYVNGTAVRDRSSNVNLNVATLPTVCGNISNTLFFYDK